MLRWFVVWFLAWLLWSQRESFPSKTAKVLFFLSSLNKGTVVSASTTMKLITVMIIWEKMVLYLLISPICCDWNSNYSTRMTIIFTLTSVIKAIIFSKVRVMTFLGADESWCVFSCCCWEGRLCITQSICRIHPLISVFTAVSHPVMCAKNNQR